VYHHKRSIASSKRINICFCTSFVKIQNHSNVIQYETCTHVRKAAYWHILVLIYQASIFIQL